MDFELSEEQRGLRDVSRDLLADLCPARLVRSLADTGRDVDEKLWRRGAELGWLGLAVPEEHDGAGQGLVELCLVAEELGRAVAPGPFVETALVALALSRSSEGFSDVVAALACAKLSASWALDSLVTATDEGTDLVLTGQVPAVHAAASVDKLLVRTDSARGPRLVLLDTSSAQVTARRTLDETRRWYRVDLDAIRVPATQVVTDEPAEVQRLLDAAAVLVAADALGVGGWLLDATVDYVKVREQFDRPLGSFQSVKHKVADMLATLRGATAATYYAAMAVDAGTPDATLSANVAKAFTTEGVSDVAGEALQTHGGIGFTWEHDLHLRLRRAKTDELVHGSPTERYDRIAALLERRS